MLDVMELRGCRAEYNIGKTCIDLLLPDGYVYRTPKRLRMSDIATVFELFTEMNPHIK